jgi:kynureninase
MGIFSLGNHSLVRLGAGASHRICCSLQWAGDNNTLYGSYASFNPFITPGLWRVDGITGSVTDLIPAFSGNQDTLNFAADPFPAPDGQLYFFYATQPYTQQDEVNRVSLQLVRSSPDGVSNRTVLLPDVFTTLNEALWAPDASFVITASGPIADVYQGGIVELYYTDGHSVMTPLLPFGFTLKWGP